REECGSAATGGFGGTGGGACGVGVTVWGGLIELVTPALSRLRRSLILAIWLFADLLAASRLAFSVAIFFASRATDCWVALFSSTASSTIAGFEKAPLAAAPTTAPRAAAIAIEAASSARRLWRGLRLKSDRFVG